MIGSKMLKKVFVWGAVFFCVLFLTYAMWVIVAMNRVATISVDYVAKVNEVTSALQSKDRSWAFYRRAGIALRLNEMPKDVFYDNDHDTPVWPSQDGWEHYAIWIDGHDNTLELLHQASTKQGFGYLIKGRIQEEDKELWPEAYATQADTPDDGFMLSVLLPQLIPMRNMAQLLAADAKQSAYEGDAIRCLQDLMTMLQMGKHLREHPILLNDLLSFAIYNQTFVTIGEIVEHAPALFSNEQFKALEQALRSLDGFMAIRLAGERYFMLDLLQRMYTDDGNGDGSIIPLDAARLYANTQSVTDVRSEISLVPAFFAPLADIFHPSRKEMLDEYTARMDSMEAVIGMPLHVLRQKPELLHTEAYPSSSTLDPYFLIHLLMPALENAVLHGEYTRARRDATLAVLFAVQQFNKTGSWPSSLMDTDVVDAWNGEPLKIKLVHGEPVIYSVGYDLDDDGGIPQKGAPGWSEKFVSDWVIWPNAL
ncbi:MAG: hypothetical protein P8N28_03050, partial [Phycisphaerales bacterium]|nr:hypothetical protein [Phycisphaerales bacterium]